MNQEIKDKLERFLPIRIVVRIEDEKVQGLVEHSFAMGWDASRANVFWSGKAYSMLGEHQLDGIKSASCNAKSHKFTEFVVDPLAEDSPIDVNWEKWLAATEKFDTRNATFTVKQHGAYILRALAAERELANIKPALTRAIKQRDEAEDKLEQLTQIINPRSEETSDED